MKRAVADDSFEKAGMIFAVATELNVVQHQADRLIPFERFFHSIERRKVTGELTTTEIRAMKALAFGHPAIEHGDVFDFCVSTRFFVNIGWVFSRLVGFGGQHRVRVNSIGDVLQSKRIALCAMLPLHAFTACGIHEIRLEFSRVLDPASDRIAGNFILNLIAKNGDQPTSFAR